MNTQKIETHRIQFCFSCFREVVYDIYLYQIDHHDDGGVSVSFLIVTSQCSLCRPLRKTLHGGVCLTSSFKDYEYRWMKWQKGQKLGDVICFWCGKKKEEQERHLVYLTTLTLIVAALVLRMGTAGTGYHLKLPGKLVLQKPEIIGRIMSFYGLIVLLDK